MADFLGAMFNGIGETFKAGAAVNVAQINQRQGYVNAELTKDQLANMTAAQRTAWLAQNSASEWNTVLYLGALLIVALIVFLIFRKK